jgi:uncharacterized membrane protein
MLDLRRSWAQLAFFALALIGAAVAIYLTSVHYVHVALVCSTQGFVDCQRVISSAYSVVPGTSLPITVPGLGWALVAAALAVVSWRRPDLRGLLVAQCAWAGLAMLAVLYLVYVELVRLHTLCAWCTSFHVVVLAMFLLSVVQLQQAEPEAPEAIENEVEEAKGVQAEIPSR